MAGGPGHSHGAAEKVLGSWSDMAILLIIILYITVFCIIIYRYTYIYIHVKNDIWLYIYISWYMYDILYLIYKYIWELHILICYTFLNVYVHVHVYSSVYIYNTNQRTTRYFSHCPRFAMLAQEARLEHQTKVVKVLQRAIRTWLSGGGLHFRKPPIWGVNHHCPEKKNDYIPFCKLR
jgi:hypothetical protein